MIASSDGVSGQFANRDGGEMRMDPKELVPSGWCSERLFRDGPLICWNVWRGDDFWVRSIPMNELILQEKSSLWAG